MRERRKPICPRIHIIGRVQATPSYTNPVEEASLPHHSVTYTGFLVMLALRVIVCDATQNVSLK